MKACRWPMFLLLAVGAILRHGNVAAAAPNEPPVRIVPQLRWVGDERTSPDGTLAVSRGSPHSEYGDSVLLIDIQKRCLLWDIPLEHPNNTAFSPDGKWLAACGDKQGFLLDLRSCRLQYRTDLCGFLLQFSPDSTKLAVVRCGYRQYPDGKDCGVFVFDLAGKELSHYPAGMKQSVDLTFSADGKTLHLLGFDEMPGSIDKPPDLLGVSHTINLETHKSEVKYGPIDHRDPDVADRHPPPRETTFERKSEQLYWNDASGLCVLPGTGSPDGDRTKVWDIRAGRFVRTLSTKRSHDRWGNAITVSGFVRPDVILASPWKNRQQGCSLIDLRTGEITPLLNDVGKMNTWCCLVGQYFTVGIPHIPDPSDASCQEKRRLELYTVSSPDVPLYHEDMNAPDYGPMAWPHDGKYLFSSTRTGANVGVRIIRTADGKFEEIRLAQSVVKYVKKKGDYPRIRSLDSDDANARLAISMSTSDIGWVVVVNMADKKVETVLEGFPYWVNAVRFVGPQRLLTATLHPGIQLWDIKNRRTLWTTYCILPEQFGYVPGGPYVVCDRLCRSGTVLNLSDGKILRNTCTILRAGNPLNLSWIQPQLIADGTWALEMVPETPLVRLVAVATGEVLLTFCTLPKEQWIVYTPDSQWDGSERVTDWVRFYRGFQPLETRQIEALRNRAAIEAALRRVFGKQAVTQSSPPR